MGRCSIGQATRVGCDFLPCVREVLGPAARRCCLAAGWAAWTWRNVEEMMGHTHGPWILSERHRIASAAADETEQWGYTVVATGNTAIEQVLATTFHVATVGANPGDLECESNARLISAAPDLLEACELLLIYLGDWDDMENETCEAARKAVAKAKGQEVPNG